MNNHWPNCASMDKSMFPSNSCDCDQVKLACDILKKRVRLQTRDSQGRRVTEFRLGLPDLTADEQWAIGFMDGYTQFRRPFSQLLSVKAEMAQKVT